MGCAVACVGWRLRMCASVRSSVARCGDGKAEAQGVGIGLVLFPCEGSAC